MKKVALFIISLLLIIPFTVHAADEKVLTLDVNANGANITYSGTTEDGITAVMCRLIDENGQDADKYSSAVTSNAFDGSLTAPGNGDYKVSCAKFEGGDALVKDVSISGLPENNSSTQVTTTKAQNSKNPKTNDGVLNYVYILIAGLVGIGAGTLYIKKTKKIKSK